MVNLIHAGRTVHVKCPNQCTEYTYGLCDPIKIGPRYRYLVQADFATCLQCIAIMDTMHHPNHVFVLFEATSNDVP